MLDHLRRQLQEEGVLRLILRVQPAAARSEIGAVLADGSIKVRVHAPPEDGKANRELVRFLAEAFDVPVAQVEIVAGASARRKVVCVRA